MHVEVRSAKKGQNYKNTIIPHPVAPPKSPRYPWNPEFPGANPSNPLDLLGLLDGVLPQVVVDMGRADLELALLDLLLEFVETAALAGGPPGGDARVEYVVHLLEGEALGLGRHQEHVDEGGGVEGAEDVVHVVGNIPQQWRDGEGEDHVEEPVGRGCQADGLSPNLAGEDLGRVGPGYGAPGGGEAGDEQVRARDDGARDGPVVEDDPGDVLVLDGAGLVRVGLAVVLLQGAADEQPRHHQEGADDQGRSAAELVEVDDGWEGHDHIDNVLNRRGEELHIGC